MLTRKGSPLSDETEAVVSRCIGCAIEVHRRLGPGYSEGIYQDALGIELEVNALHVAVEVPVTVIYRDRPLRTHRLDMVVEGEVILELKAVERLERIHEAQLISYLRSSGLKVGLLFNFNVEYLRQGGIKRRVVWPVINPS